MGKRVLGLDIREDGVNAVMLASGFKGTGIEAWMYAAIETPGDGIAPALEAIVGEMDLSGAESVVSVPPSEISFRNISIPFKDTKKVRQILPFELESTLPISVDDFIIDFQSYTLTEIKDHTDILAAMVEKKTLESYLETLAEYHIEPETITCGGYCLTRLLSQLPEFPANGMVLDIEHRICTLVVVASGQICLIRSLSYDATPSNMSTSIAVQIQRTLMAYETQSGLDVKPEMVYVTGIGFEPGNASDELAKHLEIPVQPINIIHDADIKLKIHTDEFNPYRSNTAISAALLKLRGGDGINFRKGAFAQKNLWIQHGKHFIKTGAIAALAASLAFFNLIYNSYTLKQQINHVDQEIRDIFGKTFPDVKRIVDPEQQMRVKIDEAKKTVVFQEDDKNNHLIVDLLNEISKLIPNTTDVSMTRLVIGPESLLMDGTTDTFNAVDDIKNRLEKANLFKGVSISSANIDRSDNRVRFKLKGAF